MKRIIHIISSNRRMWISCLIIFCSLINFISCIDKDDYKFNAEYVKELYEKTFPVKDIDPNHNWKTTSELTLNVTVYEDELETYIIKIYDNLPSNAELPASCLAEGSVENGVSQIISFDCPIVTDTLYVSRVDKAKRRIVQMLPLTNRDKIYDVIFGTPPSRAFSYSSTQGVVITQRAEPYNNTQISAMLTTAMEVVSGKAIGQNYGIVSVTDVYKLTKNGSSYKFQFDGCPKKSILIVTTKWTPTNEVNVGGDNLTIIIAAGGSFSGKMTITNASNLIVLKGGVIDGANTSINITNASNGLLNYNSGSISVQNLTITGGLGEFYNSGTMSIGKYSSSSMEYSLVNYGSCNIGTIDALNSNIENGCYMNISGDCSVYKLIIGNQAMLKCKSFNLNQWGDMSLIIGKNSMVDCAEKMKPNIAIQGSGYNNSLLRVRGIIDTNTDNRHTYKDVTVECGTATTENSSRQRLSQLCKYIALIDEANVLVPKGDCTAEGNIPGSGGDTTEEKSITYTFCYEDYYPVPGDYDFNDIVLDAYYKLTKVNNKITKVEIPIQLTAVGASYSLGAALQLINIPKSNVKSATVTNGQLSVGNLFASQSVESDKNNYVIIPLFNDAHYAISGQIVNRYLINTAKGHENYVDATPRRMVINIEFNDPLEKFGLDNMDLFIARPLVSGYYDGQKDKTRVEIHLREFWKYRSANGVNFENNEAIAGNRTWAIVVPDFKYPYEYVPIYRVQGTESSSTINCAYPLFQKWASDRTQSADWYYYSYAGSTYR